VGNAVGPTAVEIKHLAGTASYSRLAFLLRWFLLGLLAVLLGVGWTLLRQRAVAPLAQELMKE
jgi:hypothetical protein